MIREHLTDLSAGEPHFRWRGREATRLEGFSDAVFGFAITLLILLLDPPKNSRDLIWQMLSFPIPFAVCFALLASVWYSHNAFFRRYGLSDPWTVFLNTILLFFVLFILYPLKFVFTALVSDLFRRWGITIEGTTLDTDSAHQLAMILDDATPLLSAFGLAYAGVSLVYLLLYAHAWRLRERLGLDAAERHVTKGTMISHTGDCAVAFLSIALAVFGHVALAVYCYLLLFPSRRAARAWTRRRMPAPAPA